MSQISFLATLTVSTSLIGATSAPTFVRAGGPPAATPCASGMVCDPVLGVALTPPRGWTIPPRGHFPLHSLIFWTIIPGKIDVRLHLAIAPLGVTTACGDAQAVSVAAAWIGRSYPHRGIAHTVTTMAGAPAIVLKGVPGEPDSGLEIVVAHRGLLYSITTFDYARTGLSPSQRFALASLRFIPRHGPFPASPDAALAHTLRTCARE